MNYNKCLEYIKIKHKGQKRKQGQEYFHHPVAVSLILKGKGFSEDYQIAALFHDLLEDTDATDEEIIELSSKNILEVVKLLTKEEDYIMTNYMERIKKNEISRAVKLADRIHNLMDSIFATSDFRKKYVVETEEHYYDLAKGTIFEEYLNNITKFIKEYKV